MKKKMKNTKKVKMQRKTDEHKDEKRKIKDKCLREWDDTADVTAGTATNTTSTESNTGSGYYYCTFNCYYCYHYYNLYYYY